MNPGTVSALLQLISAAVTPVVMISACSTLILGINNKHTSLSDRMRLAAAEYRMTSTTAERRQRLRTQAVVFYRRYRLTWLSLVALYAAVAVFILTTLLILFTEQRRGSFSNAVLVCFIFGIMLMLVGVALEVAEIALSNRSLRIEMQDVLTVPPGDLP